MLKEAKKFTFIKRKSDYLYFAQKAKKNFKGTTQVPNFNEQNISYRTKYNNINIEHRDT